MSYEMLIPLLLAGLGSNVVVAFFSSWFTRKRTGAESEQIRMQSADMLISRLSLQLNDAFERIRGLEASERELKEKVDSQRERIEDMEHIIRANGYQYPLMP